MFGDDNSVASSLADHKYTNLPEASWLTETGHTEKTPNEKMRLASR